MHSTPFIAPLFILTLVAGASAQKAADPVKKGAEIRKLAGGFKFVEGPAADKAGHVFFTDIPNNRIHRWSLNGKLTTWKENTHGANGLYFDAKGRLLACQGGGRRVVRYDKNKRQTVLTASYGNKPFNSPNDLWIAPDHSVYFTDPRYGAMTDLQQGGFHVYWLPHDGSAPRRLLDDLVKPNGIVGSMNGEYLYVADPGARKIWRYTIAAPGRLTDKTLFVPDAGSDGMTVDVRGNLYLTWRGHVQIHARDGTLIRKIKIPEGPANVAFGGADFKTLFITARTSLYALEMAVRGRPGRGGGRNR